MKGSAILMMVVFLVMAAVFGVIAVLAFTSYANGG